MAYEAKIIADSICEGHRLTTMQLTHPRIVHSEYMTHGMFAKNASSSRAIPFDKMVQMVIDDPFIPEKWNKNQKGMQGGEDLTQLEIALAIKAWLLARDNAVASARQLANKNGLNVHKQIVNRLIEPWSWITVCSTGDWGAWSNYFALRCHPMAQPDIQKQAYMAQLAYFRSKPNELEKGEWHTPYVNSNEKSLSSTVEPKDWLKISIGRCARTSLLTQEGIRDPKADIALFDRLATSVPMHASPFEHVAEAMAQNSKFAKYIGWRSYRHTMPREYITDFTPNHPELINQSK